MEQSIAFESRSKTGAASVRFCRRDWRTLLYVSISALAYAFMHPSAFSTGNSWLPGVGLTLSCWMMLVICMNHIGWQKLHWSKQSGFLLGSTLLLSATYGLFTNNALRAMNLPVLISLCALCAYSLSGALQPLDCPALWSAAAHAVWSICRYFPAPAFALRNQIRSRKNVHIIEALLGIGICIPVIGLVLLLLCDADAMFSGLVRGLFKGLRQPNAGVLLWNLVRMAALALVLFAFVYGIHREFKAPAEQKTRRSLPEVTVATVLVVLCLVYAMFVYTQCRYLFAGSDAALMEGGYAVYARSGFFQLVAVAFITLLIVLQVLSRLPHSAALRFLCALVALFTMVIEVSAIWRMVLYIQVYGLTFLRVVTLWGILAISAAMIATLVKAARPQARIFRFLFVFTVCTWIAFNYANVEGRIAAYNVFAYQSGSMETIDIDYLRLLGPDAIPALDVLRRDNTLPVEVMGEVIAAQADIAASKPVPYDWSLSWLKLEDY